MGLMTSGLLALIMTSSVNMSTEMGSNGNMAAEFLDKCDVRWKEDSYLALQCKMRHMEKSEHVMNMWGESQSHLQESSLLYFLKNSKEFSRNEFT